ncbi:puromycin-sensitive aminopeptidase-like [Limulus polyphemus]|uniref:Puromycin-sensitive aminopeptidase-like n=1 Tax=Limulus polyphemus TaxID=6850 RepID=A0ABM1BIB8_LIMPO|nr:puromycin-sensitive aminopeptidase-like [Limulus polyphemus]
MPDSTSVSKPFERLPTSVLPVHYNINFRPDLQKLVFEGHETIKVEVKNETSVVVLNVLELQVKLARFTREDKLEQNATNIKVSQDDERVILTFDQPLTVGKGELYLEFSGVLNEKMKGFYRSKYTTPEGEIRHAALTQFAPTDARRAFPCWDEPALKATFDISLIAAKDLVTLSNMNIVSSKPVATNPELKEVQFATSPVMSTYLVAVVVGEFDYVEKQSGDGVQVRVYTPVGKQEQGRFALEVACKAVSFYKQYFNIAYPLPKMDLIAISELSPGAMENWGLVTYRETCLLVDPQNTSADSKQRIALIVGHELAHQWFGNLVTMEWWTHLWLNEGFASFIEFLCVNHLFPEYEIWTQFVTDVYTRALELDALHNSHPIEVPIGRPSEIDEIFDDISYNKGASVIRMLHQFLGDEVFSKGMNTYLTRHMYKNAQTEDLWQALEDVSQKPVGAIMSSWTKQKGFPVISVSCRQDGKNKILFLSQEKFCADGNAEGDNLRWLVPINITTARSPQQIVKQVLLEASSMEVLIENVEPNEWVKINPGTVGYYRTLYTPDILAQLQPAVEDQTLPPLDRLGLQNDFFALVQAGRASTTEVLKLMEAFISETSYTVWCSINACLAKLNMLLSHTDFHPLFTTYGQQLLAKIHAKLGWEPIKGEHHLDTLLRSLVIGRLAAFDEESVVNEAKKRFEAHANGTSILPADLRSAVYRAAARNGDD